MQKGGGGNLTPVPFQFRRPCVEVGKCDDLHFFRCHLELKSTMLLNNFWNCNQIHIFANLKNMCAYFNLKKKIQPVVPYNQCFYLAHLVHLIDFETLDSIATSKIILPLMWAWKTLDKDIYVS